MTAGAFGTFANRSAGLTFLGFLAWFALAVAADAPFLWPFMEPGRRLSFLLGCRTLACLPLAIGLGMVASAVTAVGIGAVVATVRARLPFGE